jgi:hypothetical protein
VAFWVVAPYSLLVEYKVSGLHLRGLKMEASCLAETLVYSQNIVVAVVLKLVQATRKFNYIFILPCLQVIHIKV